jgi:4-amino-4-deoxy-L-arabinose transferase-like glycosyltransferase
MPHTDFKTKSSLRRSLLVIAIVFSCVWLATLGARKLLDPDEARYAEIPREMLASGDWVTPRLSELKYFYKPPLQYWATALAYRIFGMNEFSTRLWCGLTGLVGVFVIGWAGAKLYGRDAGIVAAVVLASSTLYASLGHINTLDMGLSFFLLLAIVGFLLAQRSTIGSRPERNWMALAWGAVALAVLSKGIVAIALPLLTLATHTAMARDFSSWRRLHIVAGLAIFLVIAAPWFVLVAVDNPEFPGFFFLHEHVQRYLTDVSDRVEPWWYFIPLIFLGALPWSGMAMHAATSAWRSETAMPAFRSRRFLLLWIVVTVLFFSLSHSKLVTYILPASPAIALLVGDYVSRTALPMLRKHMAGIALFWFCALAYSLTAPLPTRTDVSVDEIVEVFRFAAGGFALALLGTVCAWQCLRKARVRDAILCAGAGSLLAVSALFHDFQVLRQLRSGYDIAQAIAPFHDPSKPFYSVWTYNYSLSFYLRRSMTIVDYRGELEFGQQQEPRKSLPDTASFIEEWPNVPSGSLAVMLHDTYDYLLWHNLHMIIIGRTPHLIAVRKP